MKKSKIGFLGLFLWCSLLGNTCKDELHLSHSETSFPEMPLDFRAGEKGELVVGLFHQGLMHKAHLQQAPVGSKMYLEFSKFKPPRLYSWDLNYTQKQRALQEKAQKDKEYVQLLRRIDSTRKTEYFRKVLCSPLPEAFKGDPKHNPYTNALTFSVDFE